MPCTSVERLLQGIIRLLGDEPGSSKVLEGEARMEATLNTVLTPVDQRIRTILRAQSGSIFAWPVALTLLSGPEPMVTSNKNKKASATPFNSASRRSAK